jgi:hypothetical protein
MATQLETPLMLNTGGLDWKSTLSSAQLTIWMQPIVSHLPQSAVQLVQVSNWSFSHLPLPQTEQVPQSSGQDAQVSLPLHTPSWQPWHLPQSWKQLKQVSMPGSQTPSPQGSHLPQSGAQLRQSSPSLQKPSPQNSQMPQSCGQEEHVSSSLQTLFGQVGQKPQSTGQEEQLSFPSQAPLPQGLTIVPP